MKKTLSLLLATVMLLGCLCLSACGDDTAKKIAGTYEMDSITGSMTVSGQTVSLTKDLYEYYRIILNEDGTARVESKSPNSTTKVEEDGTWTWENNVLKLKSSPNGISVVEEMEWEENKITYKAEQSADGMSLSMTLVLVKKEA